jgi:hypothetical protein
MKNNIIIAIFILTGGLVHAQTMRWVPYQPGMVTGPCAQGIPSGKDARTCYVLEYTPAVSGVLTSYTTGFFIDCGNLGPTVDRNVSCAMQSSIRLQNACATQGVYLLGSSGQGGSASGNPVEAGVPEYLHLVCFSLKEGESITIREDEMTDLTTSIDVGSGQYTTEFPELRSSTLYRPVTDAEPVLPRLDFAGQADGHLRSHLTWSLAIGDQTPARYILERSVNGEPFRQIADVLATPGGAQVYARVDDHAQVGDNDYRLQLVYGSGARTTSPVRRVSFADTPFSWSMTPNPASTFAEVRVAGLPAEGELWISGMKGEIIRNYVVGAGESATRIEVGDLPAGVYVAILKSGDQRFEQPLTVIR